MSSVDRLLGRLEQFMKMASVEFANNSKDHKDIREAIEGLNAFKWKVLGGSAVLTILISLFMSYAR